MSKGLFARLLAGVSVVLVLALVTGCVITVETVKGEVILYHDIPYTATQEFWIIEAELFKKKVSAADESIKKYTWDGTDNGFWLEYKEGVKFKDLDLWADYYIKVKDFDYLTEQVLELTSPVFYAEGSETIYVAYRRIASGFGLVTGEAAKPVGYVPSLPIIGVAVDKTAVASEKIASDRKAPVIRGLNPAETQGVER